MCKIAVFPGSFDPITIGHESVIKRALPLFDKVVVAIGLNSDKKSMFSVEQRLEFLKLVFQDRKNVEVDTYNALTAEYCKKIGAKYLLRGLRTSADFEFERMIAMTNKSLEEDIETVFLLTESQHTFINSSIVRDIIRHGGDPSEFVPEIVCEKIQEIFRR